VPSAKRAFDLLVCAVLLPVAAPLGGVVAALVRLSSPGPVLFAGVRVGRGGVPFRILKFRTMVADASGPAITAAADPRITRVGGWLRHSKLDELPQLINVARGEMSLVGPRPEDPRFVAMFPEEYAVILTVAPGVTGPASLKFRHEHQLLTSVEAGDLEQFYREDVLPRKLALDVDYVERRSLALDIRVLAATAVALFRRPDRGRADSMPSP
jgi:lipopolysaccharide/colanic/teichoic acid biosynthesis glycosyltransferase